MIIKSTEIFKKNLILDIYYTMHNTAEKSPLEPPERNGRRYFTKKNKNKTN